MSKQYKLSHKPSKEVLKKPIIKEELEMAKDLILVDILTFTPQEMADFVRQGIISVKDIEKAIPHNL